MNWLTKYIFHGFSLLILFVSFCSAGLANNSKNLVIMPICVENSTFENEAIKINRLIDYKLFNLISSKYTLLPYLEVIAVAGTRKEYCKNPFLEGRKIKEKLNISNYVSTTIINSEAGIEVNIVMRGDGLWKQLTRIYASSSSMTNIAEDLCLEIAKVYK